jgi:hypothetical protein
MYIYNSFINLRKGHSEGLKCKTVSPQGASRVPGIDITLHDFQLDLQAPGFLEVL